MTLWHGWLWIASAQRWRKVCQGDSLSQCSRRLSREGDRWGVPDRWQVMTGGAAPTFTPSDATNKLSYVNNNKSASLVLDNANYFA